MNTKKVWFITGASQGLGLSLVQKLLSEGFKVAATTRNLKALKKNVGSYEDFLPLEMDLLDEKSVKNALGATAEHFGSLDVIVNNAGYGQIGTLEELTDAEARKNFDVNVFGSLNVIRQAASMLRKQKSGHVFNIASIAGFTGGFPGFGVYCATKFAMAGFTEAFAVEMEPFNVNTTLIYPGYFRTNFLKGGSIQSPENPIQEYESARESEQLHLNQIDGNQLNDPEKAAEVMIDLAHQEQPPLHFFMGADANEYAHKKIQVLNDALEANKVLATSTAFK